MNTVQVRGLAIGEGLPKICVPIVEETEDGILKAAEEIRKVPADLVEWRADWFQSVQNTEEVKSVLGNLRQILGEMPLLFTFRTKAEGGERELDIRQYVELNRVAVETRCVDFIDVEVFSQSEAAKELISIAHQCGVYVVGSNHDFEKTPNKEELIQRLRYIQDCGVDISKMAVMPKNEKDVLILLEATQEMVSQYATGPVVTMSMSGRGSISRVSGEIFGSAITFGAMEKASAPGQIGVEQLKNMLETLHQAR